MSKNPYASAGLVAILVFMFIVWLLRQIAVALVGNNGPHADGTTALFLMALCTVGLAVYLALQIVLDTKSRDSVDSI